MSDKAKVMILSNEKGGSGKTTLAFHLIVSLMNIGHKVHSFDLDYNQQSLTRYVENRAKTSDKSEKKLSMPEHKVLFPKDNDEDSIKYIGAEIEAAQNAGYDYIVIDTPGSNTPMGRAACSYSDVVVTPLNDSFVDLDLIGQAEADNLDSVKLGQYSAMLWQQKMLRAQREGKEISWFVVRNKIASTDTINNRNIEKVLNILAKKLGFKLLNGFGDRVIYKELFLHGLTLHDAMKLRSSLATVVARNELRGLLSNMGIDIEMNE